MNEQQIKDEAKRLLTFGNTNNKLFEMDLHVRYLRYTSKEISAENVLRLTKLEWLAAGMPTEPFAKKD